MARKKVNPIDFPFYMYLQTFIEQERKKVYAAFKPLSRKFLNYNNSKENASAYLWLPQFEALEMYVFLKEFCNNKKLWQIFEDWYNKTNEFEGRQFAGRDKSGALTLFGVTENDAETTIETFNTVFNQIKSMGQTYPNYIFALTMGLGKTTLMVTCILYEFLLANKYPKDEKYCHNALIFAPDKTVLQSIKDDVFGLDKANVVPPEYQSWVEGNLKTYVLDEAGINLSTLDGSDFNLIISNTQKIILKKEHKQKSYVEDLFGTRNSKYYKPLSASATDALSQLQDIASSIGIEDLEGEGELLTNQRFQQLLRLKNLGIYVDEAHHLFGDKLQEDLSSANPSSLRLTINELAENLRTAGSSVVACYNYTGTPYVNNSLLPEVVYWYGLKEAIDNSYLKEVNARVFDNIRGDALAFCRIAISDFWKEYGEKRFDGRLPKMAFYASNIAELQNELRPAVEQILSELDISIDKVLVNVGDPKLTSNDDEREFRNLDSEKSDKQFILLVNKGKEGWNCKSLFSVGMYREPKSKVFVLQSTMRCLRKIGDHQFTAKVFLSNENAQILDEELSKNFNISLDTLKKAGDNPVTKVKLIPPSVSVEIKRVKKLYNMREKKLKDNIDFQLDKVDKEQYRIIERGLNIETGQITGRAEDRSNARERKRFSPLTLVAEIARYLNYSPVAIQKILESSKEGIEELCRQINEFNELLYDEVIPKLFAEMYEIQEFDNTETISVQLVKEPKEGCYFVKYKNGLLASLNDDLYYKFKDRSFNLDNYCFDSEPEKDMFWNLLTDKEHVDKVWFTGMLTNGQSEFIVNYIDPLTNGIRTYYPDFLVKKKDGSYVIIEVKGENKIDDAVVLAKKMYAEQMAHASGFEYIMVPGKQAKERLDFDKTSLYH